ncbi:hypothetical protein [Mycolicibacterium brumae]|nr:hypothetical protein [Mycolicibacterium brumae]RWA18490.1 hypothetical protein MBRU_04540 [Mycolicibacterium brumae DSM 44177]UWW10287.1 hypothetical protein L2Z93_003414 [Mycolicibacterium brumae]
MPEKPEDELDGGSSVDTAAPETGTPANGATAEGKPSRKPVDIDEMPYTEPHHAPIFDTGPHPQPLGTDEEALNAPVPAEAVEDEPGERKDRSGDSGDLTPDADSAPVATAWAFSDEELVWRAPDPEPVPADVEPDAGGVAPGPFGARSSRLEPGGALGNPHVHTENLSITDLDAERLSADPDDQSDDVGDEHHDEHHEEHHGPRHAMPKSRSRKVSPALPVVVPGAYQSVRLWQFLLVLAGVWVLAAGIGLGLFQWWHSALDKTWTEFATFGFVAVSTLAALLVSLADQRRPLLPGLAIALMSAPFAAGLGALALYGSYAFGWITP